MSRELLFELIEKAQWSFERKVHSSEKDKSWTLDNTFKKWFSSSIKLSPNAERFLKQTGDKSSPISLHIPSSRLALIINNNICVISLVTSDVLLEIPLDLTRSDEYNYLNCIAWSNNGKLLAYGHWSGSVCVYSSIDGQLLHELPNKSLSHKEASFVEIWFSGSDASQFIDLLCLKRTGELIRYVMSRDDIASCAEEKFDFNINCAIIDSNQNQIYIVPFNTKSILVWKIVDTKPSVIKIKEILDDEEENNDIYIYGLALSPNESCLVAILSDQSIILYQNNDYIRYLSKLKIDENRSFICDYNYWDNKTLILFYSDGSMSFHEGIETLEEYRYVSDQLKNWPRLCHRTSDELYLIDCRITKINEDDNEEENLNLISRLFRSLKDSTELINERLILIEHSDPCRLIENLITTGEYGEALRVCKVFNRTDLADQIHERELRLSSSQLGAHLTRIRSRLHVLQLCTTILYPTWDEQYQLIQFGLNQATRKQLFNNLYYSDQPFSQSIHDENLYLKDVQEKIIPLNIPQKQILLYRRKLLDEKRKLCLYDDLMKKYKIFQQYQSNIYEKFREWDYKQIALRCAREGHLNGLRLVLERAIPAIVSIDILSILNEIPERISLSEYEDLIPKYSSIEEKEFDRKENDWSDEFISSTEEIKQEIDRSVFIQWYNERIHSFESYGFIENALQLCKYAYDIENFQEFSLLYNNLNLELLLNKACDQDLTLKQIKDITEEDIFELILTFKYDFNQDDIDKRIEQILLPSMKLISQSNEYLKKNLIKKLQNGLDIYPIIRSFKLKSIFKQNEFDQLIKELILNVNSINQISICQQLLTLMNDKQDLEYIIESCRIFIKWSVRMIPSEMIRIIESEESLSNAIVLLIQSAIKEEMNKINISTGNELYHDIEQISRHRLSSQALSNLFISSLLKSDSIECFQIVRSILSRIHIPLIIQAATDYIDSAKNGQDKNIILAKHCLDLIDDSSLVVNERNLIESQNICDFFHYSITPLEIRRHPNPMQIIPAILNSNPQAYKNTSKLISLALNLQTGNKQDKKDQCMLYIAEHCLKINDLNMCWELCSYLVEENYSLSWKCCWALINKNSTYINESILSFISLHCDKILLDDVLKKSIFIRDHQSIPNEGYQLTSTYSYYSNSFYDRNYFQQMELKEIPLLKSPPIDEKDAIKYVNIDTPLFIMVYLASNTNNDILIAKDNEYALQLSIYCQSLMKSSIPRNFNAIPSSIIDKKFIENNENFTRLIQNRQYSVLNQLDNSIDLNRFENDSEYRHLTILGLFMCDNPSFEYAEQLAIKYNISIDECHHSYFEYLLTNSNLSLNEIRKKLKPFLNSERLKKNRQIKLDLVKRLHSNVFPFIDGKDYERLKLFYDIKKSLGDLTHAQKHIQAIQQLTNILNNDFDYKLFLSSPESFIEKYSNDSNIINLGLALDQVKISSTFIITSSWIYSYYLHYNPLSLLIFDLLNRITLYEDFNSVINYLISLRNVLSINKRIEIIEFSIKLIDSKEDEQWKTLEDILNKYLKKLEILFKFSSDYSQDELNQLDQCQIIEEQEEILSNILSKHGQFNLIIYLKKNLFDEISINQILQLTIEKISQKIKSGDEDSYLKLDTLLESISLDDVDEKELFSCLQKMCRSEIIDRRVRYKLIDKLDRMFDKQNLQSDDLLLFEQYRLSTLLSSFDLFIELKKEDIETDENRCNLFQKYLLQAKRNIHFESLIQILNNIWSKEQINNMKGSHDLTLKNELILTMIEKDSEWERILTENIIQFDEEEMNSLIEYLYNSKDLTSYAYKLWLIHPISSLVDLLFRSPSELMFDKKFLLMSIEHNRISDLLTINPLLFDYYLNGNLSNDDKHKVLNQLKDNNEFLLQIAQLFIYKEDYSSYISFGLIIDTIEKYFLNK